MGITHVRTCVCSVHTAHLQWFVCLSLSTCKDSARRLVQDVEQDADLEDSAHIIASRWRVSTHLAAMILFECRFSVKIYTHSYDALGLYTTTDAATREDAAAMQGMGAAPQLSTIQDATLKNEAGSTLTASMIWAGQPTVLYLIRRPGCGEHAPRTGPLAVQGRCTLLLLLTAVRSHVQCCVGRRRNTCRM